MKFVLTFRMENAAFEEDASIEAARILRELADRIEGHPHFSEGHSQPVRDLNGNEVGGFFIDK